MKLIDITRSFFQSKGYPGDPEPKQEWLTRLEEGNEFSLSCVSGCVHTATHADAPSHCILDGKTIDQVELWRYYGFCDVITARGALTPKWVDTAVQEGVERILIRGGGNAYLTKEAALAIIARGVVLVGTDAQSVGAQQDELGPHQALLSQQIAILEGLDLSQAQDGRYLLCAFPIKLDGAEGAPVRAVLVSGDRKKTCV
ncbi:MAG: cyclase family protein [Clostridiales bacterium]|nr:cyclase family protein [Clostridiales bacterium]